MTQQGIPPDFIANVLISLREKGFVLPYNFAIIGVNGALVAGVFTEADSGDGLDCVFTAEHMPDDRGLATPMNMMFVDARGEAARVVFKGPEKPLGISLN